MSRVKSRKPAEAKLPAHENASVHVAIMKRLAKMSSREIFETAVKTGIYTKKGKLTKQYSSRTVAR